MKRYRLGWAVVIALATVFLGLLSAGWGGAEDAIRPDGLQIGVLCSLFGDTPEPMMQAMMRPFKVLLEAQTGIHPQVVLASDTEQLGQQLKEGKVQLGVLHGVEFAWLRQANPRIKPLVIAVNEQRILRAYLLVSHGNDASTLADLKGKPLALARFNREHCALFLERHCKTCGAPSDRFFSKVTRAPDGEEALDQVVRGTAAATVVDGVTLDAYRQQKPACFAKLKTLQQSEPFPAAVLAYRLGGLEEATVGRIRDGLLQANQTPNGRLLLKMCRMTGFESIPADYERLLEDIAKVYPPRNAP